jgi:hypothetical protein
MTGDRTAAPMPLPRLEWQQDARRARCRSRKAANDDGKPIPRRGVPMNLIYSPNYASARSFALAQELAPGDWKWLSDGRVVREYPRADVY